MTYQFVYTMTCTNCGETMVGDGYRTSFHCPNAPHESFAYSEPDGEPIFCPIIHVSEWTKEKGPVANRPMIAKGNNLPAR